MRNGVPCIVIDLIWLSGACEFLHLHVVSRRSLTDLFHRVHRLGWGTTLTFLPYGDQFRRHRKLVHSHLMMKACEQYQPMQLENAHLLVGGLLETSGEYEHALTRYASTFNTIIRPCLNLS